MSESAFDDFVASLRVLVEIYYEDFLSAYQRTLLRRDVARARLTLYRLRKAVS